MKQSLLFLLIIHSFLFVNCKGNRHEKVVEAKSYDRKCSVFRSIPLTNLPQREILFLGHSLINEFLVDEYIPHGDSIVYINMGIGGDDTKGCFNRRYLAFDRNPSLIIMNLGINDLLNSEPIDSITYYYGQILDDAKKRGLSLIVCSIIPNSKHFEKDIRKVNSFLKRKCFEHQYRYIDLFTPMNKDGALAPKYNCGDNTHLTGAGYTLWADTLKNYI